MKVDIVLNRDGEETVLNYDYQRRHPDEKPMVLDILLQAQATSVPDLAFRYGCRARNCGVCTVDLNGQPRVACRARAREGDRISPVNTLPVLADLVVKRDGIARQMRGRLVRVASGNDLNQDPPEDYHELTACIECYACLQGCPLHARNFAEGMEVDASDPFTYGNPFSLLKLQILRLDPMKTDADREKALAHAKELGLNTCKGCSGCKCGVGINLMGKVVRRLLAAASEE